GGTYLEGWLHRAHHQRLDLIRQADLVLTISEHTRKDVLHHLGVEPGRVAVIGAGTSEWFRPPTDPARPGALVRRSLPAVTRPFVLSVGSSAPHKNLAGLVRGWARVPAAVRRALQLVVACRLDEPAFAELAAVAGEAGLGDDEVVLTGYVDDEVLRALYQAARLFVLASRYEGFGLPVAEAIRCGCPAVTSSTTSLPEILCWPPSTFDPDDPDDLARRVAAGLEDGPFRDELVRRAAARTPELTWAGVAAAVVGAVDGLDGDRRARPSARRPARPTIAVVGPLPPVDSGIATYNGRLLEELARMADVVAFDPTGPVSRHDAGYEAASLLMIETMFNPWSFDHLVYTLGNSVHHVRSIEALRRYPGVAWLHDVRLAGPAWGEAQGHPDPDRRLADRLVDLYPAAVPPTTPHLRALPNDMAVRGIGMTGQVVADCTGLLVGSHLAARLLALDQRPGSLLPPLEVLPLAVPRPPVTRGPEEDPPLVVALGIVHAVKQPLVLVEALALARRRRPVRLAFVGWIGDDMARAIAESAEALGVAELVTTTGNVSDEEYWRWLARATVGVQLRATTFGESSAAVNDLLALGVPCITNVAAASELPEGTVHRLAPGGGAEALAAALVDLLDDPARRHALANGGRAEAARRTFAATA
ncbi:MAG: glycosyltransferase, partial [Acidimicrobiales bacterium]